MGDQWIECSNCSTEFRVLSDNTIDEISFCPYCGNDVFTEMTDEDFEEDDDYERD